MVQFAVAVLFLKAPNRLWVPPSRMSNEYQGEEVSLPGGKAAGT